MSGGEPDVFDEMAEEIPRRWKIVWAVGCAALAAGGAAGYIAAPGVASNKVGGFMILPGYIWAVVWVGRRLPEVVRWVAAVPLAVGGVVAYLIWPDANWWFFGGFLIFPLGMLVGWRAGMGDAESEPWFGGMQDGPWGPP
jgi:hypothetical protein